MPLTPWLKAACYPSTTLILLGIQASHGSQWASVLCMSIHVHIHVQSTHIHCIVSHVVGRSLKSSTDAQHLTSNLYLFCVYMCVVQIWPRACMARQRLGVIIESLVNLYPLSWLQHYLTACSYLIICLSCSFFNKSDKGHNFPFSSPPYSRAIPGS